MQVIELARENMVVILCFPPHCTHKMQPLDVGFMGPFNSYFGKEISTLQRQNVTINLENLFSIFGRSFLKAAKIETAVNSFKKCGIHLFNTKVFSESDFAASKRDASLSPSTKSEAKITEYREVLKDIMNSSAQSNSTEKSNSYQPSIQCTNSSHSRSNNAEGEVRIPLSYIMQAKPLINLLSSYLNSNTGLTGYATPELLGSNNVDIELPVSALPQMPRQTQNDSPETTNTSATQSMIPSNEIANNPSLPTSQETPIKRGRTKGKAAIITEDKYKENVMAEKIKNIKKEKVEKTYKLQVKSNGPLSTQHKLSVPQPQKRKQTSTITGTTKKIKPLTTLNNQLDLDNITTPMSQQPLQIIGLEALPLQENQFFVQEDGIIVNPSLINALPNQNCIYYVNEHDLQFLNL